MKRYFFGVLIFFTASHWNYGQHSDYNSLTDLSYYDQTSEDPYLRQRCKLDLYYPQSSINFSTVIWFHGGGLTRGSKSIPEPLKNQGVAVVAVNYRLHPLVNAPVYIEDAAAAVAWVFKNIKRFGGNRSKIYVGGFSSGGYLSLMVSLDEKWLEKYSIHPNEIRGVVTLSATTFTNHTIRKEYGIPITQALIDYYAPVFHARGDAPPITLITGAREKEFYGMYEENAYLRGMLKINGHDQNELIEIGGYGHEIIDVGIPLLIKRVEK